MSEHIEGYIEHIIYRNEENGYTVLSLEYEHDSLTCVGTVGQVSDGEYLSAEGEFSEHPVYGPQFQIRQAVVKIPGTGAALERYLASGAVKGIGKALAGRILKQFGDDTLRILEEEPERLAEVKGISAKKAREIGLQIEERSLMQNALIFLSQYGISYHLGIKIFNQYQDTLYRVLQENPYRLAEDIPGVGFRTADEIASRIGIRTDSEYRIRSGLLYTMSQAGARGHMYLPEAELLRVAGDLLGVDPAGMDKYVMDLVMDRKLMSSERDLEDGGRERLIYTAQSYYTELSTARMLRELNLFTREDPERVLEKVRRIERSGGMTLDDRQREAVVQAATHGLLILTGGPGTGKTTTINTMIRYFRSERLTISLAAPTGRAAKRMTEATGYEASTIHRLLELSGMADDDRTAARFERNADHPLEADVIIIDEVSMVDSYLMYALLSAIVPGTRLILVGDRNQLPSVGPGSVLRDMIRSGAFPVISLTHIFRQAQESDIIVNAHRINAGMPVSLDNKSKDFFFLQRDDVRVIQKVILTMVSSWLPNYTGAKSEEVQVLTPMRKGVLGVENLNRLLQKYLNPPSPDKAEKENGDRLFRVGDKVMQIRNNYQTEWEIRGKYGIPAQQGMGVFNGDMGVVDAIDHENEILTVRFDEARMVEYPFRQLDELELAYATTIHKAQGSEYPAVVIPVFSGPQMLMTRNLLYTAVTRARKCVVLTGSAAVFEEMIANKTEANRYTTLCERIIEAEEEARRM